MYVNHQIVNPHAEKWAHLKPNQYCTLKMEYRGYYCWVNPRGQYHRVDANGIQDGPALISPLGQQTWFLNEKRHRIEGPAVICPDGTTRWYLDGNKLTQEQWAQDTRVIHHQVSLGLSEEHLRFL